MKKVNFELIDGEPEGGALLIGKLEILTAELGIITESLRFHLVRGKKLKVSMYKGDNLIGRTTIDPNESNLQKWCNELYNDTKYAYLSSFIYDEKARAFYFHNFNRLAVESPKILVMNELEWNLLMANYRRIKKREGSKDDVS